jgi:hypothetical protein
MMRFSTLAVAVAIAPLAVAQDESMEEVVVTSSLVHSWFRRDSRMHLRACPGWSPRSW